MSALTASAQAALAEVLGAPLVTGDRRLIRGLPKASARAIFLGAL